MEVADQMPVMLVQAILHPLPRYKDILVVTAVDTGLVAVVAEVAEQLVWDQQEHRRAHLEQVMVGLVLKVT